MSGYYMNECLVSTESKRRHWILCKWNQMFVSPTCRLEIDQSMLFTVGSSLQCWLYLVRPAFPWVLRFQSLGPHVCTSGTFCIEWCRGTSWDERTSKIHKFLFFVCLFSFCWSCANKDGLDQNTFSTKISLGSIWSWRVFICLLPRNGCQLVF